ncbi:MAG: GlsB/YeaQ/YmgE family stress response membrane protein [Paracoccus sp. (in: a-proteobacteria)]|nr:GlsB/YeaQ/YmgE family stress response membrane protein [Paracoccus sp. (in: a-proteobacteria)]
MPIIVALIVGAVAGWLAGLLVKGHGQGLLMNVVVGILGAVVASFLLPAAGMSLVAADSVLGAIIHATIGAIILLMLLRLVKQA